LHTVTSLEHICKVITNPLRNEEEKKEEKEEKEEGGGELKRQALHFIPLGIKYRILVKE